nr:uncharacterized protein LOC129279042 [Lytechinus pictus]
MATRLTSTVVKELRMTVEKTIFFTDSLIVLSLIRSQARVFKPFVSARVGEVQSSSDPSQWRHVPGSLNPADDISRGISVDQLHDRWKTGPDFLRLPDDQWPQDELQAGTSAGAEERRNVKAVMHIVSPIVVDCTRVSSWRRLLRITAYVLRFA